MCSSRVLIEIAGFSQLSGCLLKRALLMVDIRVELVRRSSVHDGEAAAGAFEVFEGKVSINNLRPDQCCT